MEHQPEPTLIELIRYNNWANSQVINACLKLSKEQRHATAPGTYGSVVETLGHLIWAEADYIGRLTGHRPKPPFNLDDQVTLADLAAYASQVAEALLDAVKRTSPDYIVHEEEDGKFMDYQACLLFIQVIDHGIEHRTNITTIISSLGLPALEIDGWGYLFAHPEKFQLKEGTV